MNRIRRKQHDLAIIGISGSDTLKLQNPPDHGSVICYQPTVYLPLEKRRIRKSSSVDFQTILSIVKNQPVGTPLCPDGEPLSFFNNPYWVFQKYLSDTPVWKKDNIVLCNGWVLPQDLIRDGFLEGN